MDALELPFPDPIPAPWCWYCGSTAGPFENEHQVPVSRGGKALAEPNVVVACARCNDLKGPLSAEEFRLGLAERLGAVPGDVVFAGEATDDVPATARIATVRSLEADRRVTKLDADAGDELYRAARYLRTTAKALASDAIRSELGDRRRAMGVGERWPDATLGLFEEPERKTHTGARALAQLPPVPQDTQHTRTPGPLLDLARARVAYRQSHGEPDLRLLDWIAEAFALNLTADEARYPDAPTLADALAERYGGSA